MALPESQEECRHVLVWSSLDSLTGLQVKGTVDMVKKTTKGSQVDVAVIRETAKHIVAAKIDSSDRLVNVYSAEVLLVVNDWLRLNPAPVERPVLTAKQEDIFEFLLDQFEKDGTSPTIREIGSHFGIRSPNGVMCHLKALSKKGLLYQLPGSKARGWRIKTEFVARA